MKIPSNISKQEFPWQATVYTVLLNLKDEVLFAKKASDSIPERSRREFSKEASYMIYLMLGFTLLAVLGSAITVYEFLFEDNEKKMKSLTADFEEKSIKKEIKLEKQNKFQKYNGKTVLAWLEDSKSLLKFFCVFRNGAKILSIVSSEDKMDCLQGLRFASNLWIISGHTAWLYFYFLRDPEKARNFLELRMTQLIWNSTFAVDIFLVISGFLNAYNFFHLYNKRNGNISWIPFYYKRFLRLTPVYMIVLGFYSTLFVYTSNGITWPTYQTNPICKEYWWMNLLYLQNFEEASNQCMAWTWYLAVDMQFYIISPLFFISLLKWPRFGLYLVCACIVGSCVLSFMLTYWFNLVDGISRIVFHLADLRTFAIRFWKYFDVVYSKPYTRISPYLVGMTLGYYLHSKNRKVTKDSKMTLSCGWILSTSLIWISFFLLFNSEGDSQIVTAIYNGTKSLLFSCSVAWILYACLTGQAECLNNCLSWKGFLPFSRLTYCAYLIHEIILMRHLQQAGDVLDFSLNSLMSLYLYMCVFTYAVSFIVSLLFEIPLLNILEWISKQTKEKTSRMLDSVSESNFLNHYDIYKIS